MKKILWRIWSIWAVTPFALFFILMQPVYFTLLLFKGEGVRSAVHNLNTIWGMVLFAFGLIRIKVHGKEKIDKRQTYIWVPNHSSYLDIPVCNFAINQSFRYIGKAELSKIPLFGYMFNKTYITVKRESRMDSYRSFVKAKDRLEAGISVLIYPEATIPDKRKVKLKKFKDGAFRLAIHTGIPVVPLTVIGGHQVLPDDGSNMIYPGTVHVYYGDPIPTEGLTEDAAPGMRDDVFEIISKTMDENGYENLKVAAK